VLGDEERSDEGAVRGGAVRDGSDGMSESVLRPPHLDPVLPGGGSGVDGIADVEPLGVERVISLNHDGDERCTKSGCPAGDEERSDEGGG
jgi:hypothetical protein